MQKNNRAGEQTRRQIYNTAKELFYEKGFDGTSYADIHHSLNINKGLIPYHFKSKYALARMIYDEVELTLDQIISENLPQEPKIVQSFGAVYTFQKLIRSNSCFGRFCYELTCHSESPAANLEDQYRFIQNIWSDIKNPPEESHLRTVATLCNGIDIEIIRGSYLGFLLDPPEEVFRMDTLFLLKELGYTEDDGNALIRHITECVPPVAIGPAFSLRLI